jgi:hypothetical protein
LLIASFFVEHPKNNKQKTRGSFFIFIMMSLN